MSKYKFKIGDVVDVQFKPKELNPYMVIDVSDREQMIRGRKPSRYIVGRELGGNGFEVLEEELLLHISEKRDKVLKQLGI